jgi:hypothetical protein
MDEPSPRFKLTPMPAPKRPKRGAFPQPAFKDAAGDLKSIFSTMNRRRWLFLCLSFAMTFAVLFGFLLDSDFRKLGPGEQLIYVESWRANRTDAEIVAQQKRDQTVRHRLEEERRRQYEKLGNTLGIE